MRLSAAADDPNEAAVACVGGVGGAQCQDLVAVPVKPQTDYKHDIPRNILIYLFRCAFPPLLMTLIKPLSRVLAVVVGRSARIWWQRLPKEHKFQARLSLLQHR